MSTLTVQSITGVTSFDFSNTSFASAYGVANAAFGKANTALQNTSGTFAGTLNVTGNVGIGSISDFSSTGKNAKFAVDTGGINIDDGYYVAWGGGTGRVSITGNKTNGTLVIAAAANTSGYMTFSTGNAERMRIIGDGKIGIGTTSPYTKLQVVGTIYSEVNAASIPQILLGSPGANYGQIQNDDTGKWSLGYGATNSALGTPVLSWNSSGKVGIGTSSPSTTLDVVGTFRSLLNNEGVSTTGDTIGRDFVSGKANASCVIGYAGEVGMIQGAKFDLTDTRILSMQPYGGDVGIGTTSPVNKLDVMGNISSRASSGTALGAPQTFEILNGLSVGSPVSARLAFGTDNTGWQFRIAKNNVGTYTDYFTITDGGNVGIGTTSPGVKLDVSGSIRSSGSITIGSGGNYQAGSIYADTNWGMLYRSATASPAGGALFAWKSSNDATEYMRIDGSALSLTGLQGVKFQATQSASSDVNTLDDYEKGTWTPAFTTDATGPTGVTYSYRSGTYTKIGDLVYFRCTIQLSSKGTGGTGNVLISGIPFSPVGLTGGYAYQPIAAWFYPQSGDTFTSLYASIYDSGGYIFVANSPKATDMTAWSSFGNSSKISFAGCYKVS